MSQEKENGKTKQCKYCKQEIDASAKICPHCRKKQKPSGCLVTIIVVIVLIAIALAGSSMSGGDTTSTGAATNDTSTTQQQVSYTAYSVSELMNDLNTNAMNASDKYKGQYVELTGRLGAIDSDGNYISILPENDQFAIIGVSCYFQSDEQRAAVKNAATGDTLVVKGKITSVGEVFGYSLNIDEVSAQ